jgi:hypothetical protein
MFQKNGMASAEIRNAIFTPIRKSGIKEAVPLQKSKVRHGISDCDTWNLSYLNFLITRMFISKTWRRIEVLGESFKAKEYQLMGVTFLGSAMPLLSHWTKQT